MGHPRLNWDMHKNCTSLAFKAPSESKHRPLKCIGKHPLTQVNIPVALAELVLICLQAHMLGSFLQNKLQFFGPTQ